ncbi:MAG: hypothetical protein R3C10_21715 [Pirellulales bacterium]
MPPQPHTVVASVSGIVGQLARGLVVFAWALATVWATPATVRGGGGADNLFLVVNARSWASVSIANLYIELRNIPSQHVLYLDWGGSVDTVDVETFRNEILAPVMQTIQARGLDSQIDYVAYSCDFPYSIDMSEETGPDTPQVLTPKGSLNSMTYLYEYTLTKNPEYIRIDNNRYYQRSPLGRRAKSYGFRRWYGWGEDGELIEVGEPHYMLSTMLAMTSGRGNSVREAVYGLQRAVAADGTHPSGTIYYMKNTDVRSTTRDRDFTAAKDAVVREGVKAEVVNGIVPQDKADVMGAMMGTPKVDWAGSKSTILPGAICEHFTSSGGLMAENGGQTPLTELIRYGAAGASGTVVEPLAVANKFPHPAIQVHYVRGCSLAESYYQSVQGPFQLLIVGDPLCRPWANIPEVEVKGVSPREKLSGSPALTASGKPSGDAPVDRFEWYLNGVRVGGTSPDQSIAVDTTQVPDGYAEVSVAGIEATSVATQGRTVIPVLVDNHGHSVRFVRDGNEPLRARWATPLNLTLEAPGAKGIEVYQYTRTVGRIDGEKGDVTIHPVILGFGKLKLSAVAMFDNNEFAVAEPIDVTVESFPPFAAIAEPAGPLSPGLKLVPEGGRASTIEQTSKYDWLEQAGVKADQAYSLSGYFQVRLDDIYQFHVRHPDELSIAVDGNRLYDVTDGKMAAMQYVPVPLRKGWHKLEVTGKSSMAPRLDLRFGGPGAFRVSRVRFSHD